MFLSLTDWCKREREKLQSELNELRSGKLKVGEDRGSGWTDATSDRLHYLGNKVTELNSLISRIEQEKLAPADDRGGDDALLRRRIKIHKRSERKPSTSAIEPVPVSILDCDEKARP